VGLFSKLYAKVMVWSRHKYASYWLALVSFTESFCFVISPDIMLAPMTLAKPEKAWLYAGLTTISSVVGGMFGYLIGMYAFQTIEPWLVSLGYQEAYITVESWFADWGFWAIFVAGFTPIPFKMFTIAAGVASMAFIPFVLGATISRGLRYFLEAGLMWWGGERLEKHLHDWIDRIGWITLAVITVAYFIYR
jgi:membrane protein YqaA with SNARE-associated domain